MRLHNFILASMIALAFAGCSGGEKKLPIVGETKDFSTVCDKANDGKRVAVEGYLRFPEEVKPKIGLVLRMYQTADFSAEPVGVSSDIGSQANQVELMPKEYTNKDLKVHTADGQIAGLGTRVRVSGDVYFPLVQQEFKCALSNPLVEIVK